MGRRLPPTSLSLGLPQGKVHRADEHRGPHGPPAATLVLTSEMSIWFLYQTTVGLGVAWVRQCK